MTDHPILVGVIRGACGLKGDVRIRSFTADVTALQKYGELQLNNGQQLTIIRLRPVNATEVVACFKGITDRDTAESLKGQELYINRTQLPPVEEGVYYYADLLTLHVQTEEGTLIGKVKTVHNFGASDILDIQTLSGKPVMVPFIQDAIQKVDLDHRMITIRAAFMV
jgi:16S rRNA processing protein RimM